MSLPSLAISGIGSVSPYGALCGTIDAVPIQPRQITKWPVEGIRRAFLVEPFRPSDVVPGLKTRRLDRLSVWALVTASLAIKDARLDLSRDERSRVAVVCGTGLGCIELTESFLQSALDNGWAQTDPILFPETLWNSPASHVARCLELTGPNVTLSSTGQSGECALAQAASMVRFGQADRAIVIAGDLLTRTAYEWYEAAALLSTECTTSSIVEKHCGFIPSEAVTAMVLEKEPAHVYAHLRCGSLAGSSPPARTDAVVEVTEGILTKGLGGSGALLQLAMSLHGRSTGTLLRLGGTPPKHGSFSLLLEVA
jgi:3-oxoacyl-(acyl-carrier-protein) synthase